LVNAQFLTADSLTESKLEVCAQLLGEDDGDRLSMIVAVDPCPDAPARCLCNETSFRTFSRLHCDSYNTIAQLFQPKHVTLRAARESLPFAAPETNGVSSVQQQQQQA
jgi:hypothetical protein